MRSMSSRGDRGATAITLAITMIVIMGMAAIAIDLGLGFNERRLDQTGADTSVMAGAVEVALGGQMQLIVDQVTDYVNLNVRPVSDAEWEACVDPEALPLTIKDDFSATPATECISFFAASRIRVRLPDQTIDTTFGRILGFDTLTTNAAAEAIVFQFSGEANSPPFVALSGVAGGELICLRTTSRGPPIPALMTGNGSGNDASLGSDPDPCDETEYDPDSQFFGTLDPLTYFNNQTGTVSCKQRLTDYAIAAGIDHTLSDFEPDFVVGVSSPTGGSVIEDDCNPEAIFGINTMSLMEGLDAQVLRCGMLTLRGGGPTCSTLVSPGSAGGSSVPARLHLGPFAPSGNTFVGEDMDNQPLWYFMSAKRNSWPQACRNLYDNRSAGTWDYFDKKDELIQCLKTWNPASGQLFLDSIVDTPRFAWIPWLAEDDLTTEPSACPSSAAPKCVHFNDFMPIYMQTLYTLISGNGVAGACDDPTRTDEPGPNQRWGRHDAGEPIDCGRNNGNLDRLAAFALDCEMLSTTVCNARPGYPPGGEVIPRLELVK